MSDHVDYQIVPSAAALRAPTPMPTVSEYLAAQATIDHLIKAIYRYAPDRSRPALETLVRTAQEAQAQWSPVQSST